MRNNRIFIIPIARALKEIPAAPFVWWRMGASNSEALVQSGLAGTIVRGQEFAGALEPAKLSQSSGKRVSRFSEWPFLAPEGRG